VIKFWRKLRPKTLASDYLANLKYTILGLGDTNYNDFCNAPKNLHRRLTELGACTFYSPDWADDGTGLEIVVEPWLEGVFDALESVIKSETMDSTRNKDPLVNGVAELSLKGDAKSSYTIPSCPKPFLNIEFCDTEKVEPLVHENLPSQAGECVKGRVVNCQLLSDRDSGKEVKDYFEIVIDCDKVDYSVGDTVGVMCHNDEKDVEKIKRRLDSDSWSKPCLLKLRTDLIKPKSKLPAQLPSSVTSLEFLFTSALDLRCVPKKLFVRALLEHTTSDEDRDLLSQFCSKEGAKAFAERVTEKKMTILELLDLVPSCIPPATVFLEHLPRLLPRPYSISSSVMETPGQISWLFTKVTEPQPGVATTWMSGLKSGDSLSFYPRVSNNFCPPADAEQSYIMVCAGSGLGPFLSFLKDRKMKREKGEGLKGKCWLMYGCRFKDADSLYDKLIKDKYDNVLDKVSLSFSRETESSGYVQNKIEEEKVEILNWLIDNKSMVFVCGDAKGMANGVKEAIKKILKEKLGDLDGAKFFQTMIADKKYKEDIWT